MQLFDDIIRNHMGPALHAESTFEYLNRSARPSSGRIRQLLDEWFARYPCQHQAELRERFRAPRENASAFFELSLHALLCKLGYSVEVHPVLEHASTHPDFAVTTAGDDLFYLEAQVVTGESAAEAAARARKERVYDALDRLESLDFFIGMRTRGAPETPPPARCMRSFLLKHLSSLDSDLLIQQAESRGLEAMPRWHFQHDGWDMEFFPIAKGPEARGKPGVRPLGIRFEAFWNVQTADSIRKAVEGKGHRYGTPASPYVVALNVLDESMDNLDLAEALFGKQLPIGEVDLAALLEDPQAEGAWISGGEPRWTRVSAVLLTVWLRPWSIARAGIFLCHHPWAKLPVESELTGLSRLVPVDNRMQWQPGLSLANILGLPPEWPAT
jgi:hypothetical protein